MIPQELLLQQQQQNLAQILKNAQGMGRFGMANGFPTAAGFPP